VPPAKISDFIAVGKPTNWVADAAFGIVLGSGADDAQVHSAAQALGGTATFHRRDGASGPPLFDVPSAQQRHLLERLKQAFDPDNRLAPLPWKAQPINS
jgi:hypothetical protein